MKKLIAILVAGLAFTASLFADVPEFTDETAYVVDASVLPGNMKDNVVVTNVSSLAANLTIYFLTAKCLLIISKEEG